MQTQNVIKTIFSFTSEGLEGWLKQMTEARAEEVAFKKTGDELNKTITDTSKLLDAQIKRWQLLDSTMNSDTPKKVRQEYAQLTKDIEANTAAKAKAVTQQEANTKALNAETKKLKEAEEMAKTYRKVVDELAKGLDNAEVSTSALAKAKKYLNDEMAKTNVGTEKYQQLAKDLATVTKASNDVTAAQRQQVKELNITSNSIAALRLKVSELKNEWLEMDRADPGFQAKAEELKRFTDELTKAEEEVGIFTRSVGNYAKAGEAIVPALDKINSEFPIIGEHLSRITGLMDIAVELSRVQASQAGLVAKAKNLWTAATTKLAVALGITNVQAQILMATLTLGLSAAITGVIYLLSSLGDEADNAATGYKNLEHWIRATDDALKDIERRRSDAVATEEANTRRIIALMKEEGATDEEIKAAQEASIKRINEIEIAAVQQRINSNKKLRDEYSKTISSLELTLSLQRSFGEDDSKIQETIDKLAEYKDALAQVNSEITKDLANEKNIRTSIIEAETNKKKEAAEKAESAVEKARQAQNKRNADYLKAIQDRQKAAEDVAKAEAEGDTEGLIHFRAVLKNKEIALEAAAKKRLSLSQDQLDTLELQEYQHEKNLEAIRKEAEEKKTSDYLSAVDAVRTARESLLTAEKEGNTEQVELYKQMLDLRLAALAKYNAEEVQLTEEQRLQQELADAEFKQERIDEYTDLQTEIATLEEQYRQAQTEQERQVIQKQIDALKTKTEYQIAALEALGVNASEIVVESQETAGDTEQYLADRLRQSIETIQTYAGEHQNAWFKFASSIGSLTAKAFDISKIRKKYGKDAEGIKKANEEIKQSMIDLGAAVALTGLEAVTSLISDSIEQEKQALEEFYEWQEERAQESYDRQSQELQDKLDANAISEAKYKLEQMKLDDEKAEEDANREKEKANKLYDLELKQFRVEQAQAAISAVIATAVAIMQAWATSPLTAPALTAVISVLGAAQVASIYAQKPPEKPKFEKGGYLDFVGVDGPSHAEGGVPVKIGDREVAEVEGGEGALIISKKAMRNKYMRRLLAKVEALNAGISGERQEEGVFAEGGYLSYDEDFFQPARNSLKITKRRKRSIRINGKKVKLKPYGFNADAAIDAAAEEIAIPKWNAYIDSERAKLESREKEITDAINSSIGSSETLRNMGITDIDTYNKVQTAKQDELDTIEDQIKIYEDAADARTEALKAELQYEQKLAEFEKQRQAVESELNKATEEFSIRVLGELRDTAQITEEEYLSMLDQVKHGYGVTYSDIIDLKKQEVEAIKASIEEERNAEIEAANEVATYRENALEQIRTEWEENYNAITQQIIEDVESASEAVSQLTGTDLERFNEILRISREIAKMEEDYQKNETLLNDGVVQSREERARLLAEQKRIQEELEQKQQEAEDAKAAFEEERAKNLESARAAYETENFSSLLEQIKQLGSELQEEGNKWTLDKAIAAELDDNLQAINATYDEQIALQDAVIDGLQAEIDKAQLLHDQKMAYIQEEEDALQASFEEQQAEIESWLADVTSDMRMQASDLSQYLAALKVAGIEAGLTEYEKAIEELGDDIDKLDATGGKKYATGGAIELGNGLYQVTGPSHSQGGVPVSVGGTKIAEVEGIEKMFAVNKLASYDPEMIAALQRASDVNARYTGVPLIDRQASDAFMLDYERQAALIGQQINQRPVHTYLTHRDIDKATRIQAARRRSSWME